MEIFNTKTDISKNNDEGKIEEKKIEVECEEESVFLERLILIPIKTSEKA